MYKQSAADGAMAAIAAARLVPVIVINDVAGAEPLARALKEGGLNCAEVTFRTDAAEEALRVMAEDPGMVVGAGTVLDEAQVDRALQAGARYIVTPGFNPRVVHLCQQRSVPIIPGVATATEVQMALDAGVEVVKFFPAEAMGGIATLKALSAPYPMVRFIPTGGITSRTLRGYLDLPCVAAVGGSWMVASELLISRNFIEVARLTSEAMSIAHGDAKTWAS